MQVRVAFRDVGEPELLADAGDFTVPVLVPEFGGTLWEVAPKTYVLAEEARYVRYEAVTGAEAATALRTAGVA